MITGQVTAPGVSLRCMTEQDRPAAPPGWYPHPEMANTQAYWDGTAWTGQVAPAAPPADPNASTLASLLLVTLAVVIAVAILWGLAQMVD